MANKYPVVAGGNWNTDATWTLNSDGTPNATTKPSASDAVFMNATSGNVTIDATATALSLDCTGYTGTLTHNAFSLTISGNVTMVSGMTYTAITGSSFSINASGTLTSGTKTFRGITINNGTVTLGDNLTFSDIKTSVLTLGTGAASLSLNGFTVSGFSSTSRVLINSSVLGTSKTITNTTGTFANADFRDITFSTNADYSAITGKSGDCGGNSGATLTTGTTQTYTGGTGSWSDVTKWTSRVPLPQDDVSMSGVTGGTITADMPRLGKSIDWTGASGSPTWAVNSTANTHYGSLTLISAMTFTHNQTWTFETRTTSTLTSAGKSFGSTVALSMFGGTLTLQDSYASTSSTTQLNNGTFNANGFNVTVPFFNSSNSNTRSISMGSGTWTLTSSGGTSVWITSTTTGLTFNSGTSTILLSDITASSKTFAGGGLTYNNLQITGGGAGAVIITGSNSFARLPQIAGGTKTLQITAGTTQTFRSVGVEGFGNGSNVITIQSTSGGSTYTFSRASGIVSADYLSLQDSIATGGAEWYAGANSTNVSGNSGWFFTIPQFVASENLTKAGTSWVWGLDPNSYAYGALLQQEWVPSSSNATIGNSGLLTSAHLRQTYGNLTFFKDYASASSSVDADFSVGSGTGTFTVTRSATTPATIIDSQGRIQLVQHTGPRFTAGFYNSTGFVSRPGLIVEGASTNMFKDGYFSQTKDTYWTNSGGTYTLSSDYSNPYASGNVAKLVCTLADDKIQVTGGQLPSVTTGTTYTVSALVRSTTTDPLYFRYSDGALQTSGNFTPSTTSWTLIQWQVTAANTGFLSGFSIANKNAVSRTFYVAYMQFEALPFASSFVPTTTASASRAAETLTYPTSGNRTAATESIFIKQTPYMTYGTEAVTQYFLENNGTNPRSIRKVTGANTIRFNADGSATVDLTPSISSGQSFVIAGIAVGATGNPNTQLYIDGGSVVQSNTDWTNNPPSFGAAFSIGSQTAGGNNIYGIIQSIAIFSDAKSAADVASITRTLQ